MPSHALLNDTQIRITGIEALNKALGPTGALRFLSLVNRKSTDYVKISRRLYKNQTVDAIFKRTKMRDRKPRS